MLQKERIQYRFHFSSQYTERINMLQQSAQINKIARFLFNKNNTLFQIIKYVFCGGISTIIDMTVFFAVAWCIFPALTEQDCIVQFFHLHVVVPEENTRIVNFCIANIIAFGFSNGTAYILNALFVFKKGHHRRKKQILLFYLLSTIVALCSIGLGMFLIKILYLSTTLSYLTKVLSSVAINYSARKAFVFN